MFYEIAQSALTVTAEVIAIAGITGIIAHAIWSQHQHFMTEFCPPVAPYQPEVEAQEAPAVVEAVEVEQPAAQPEVQAEVDVDALEDDGLTGEYGVEEVEEFDLTTLDPTALRKLCTNYEITWRHARGKNRHATKSMMIHQISLRLTA